MITRCDLIIPKRHFAILLSIFLVLNNTTASAQSETPPTPFHGSRQEALNNFFNRSALPTPRAALSNKTYTFRDRQAFTTKEANLQKQSFGWNKTSNIISLKNAQPKNTKKVRIKNFVHPYTNSSPFFNKSRWISAPSAKIDIKPASGFSRQVEIREYRGRLPAQAIQALEQIKQRELTIEEVRALLNKHQRPD